MKRSLIALVAVSMLGTGCIVHDTCDSHTVWIEWTGFTRAVSGGYQTTVGTCFSDFAEMHVFVDSDTSGFTAPCSDGSIPFTLPTGSHRAIVEAVDTAGTPLARDEVSFYVSDSCSDQTVNTYPGESVVTLDYTVPAGTCSGSFLWFKVDDALAGPIAEVDEKSSLSDQERYHCGDPIQIILPAGDLSLDRIEQVTFPTADTFSVESRICGGPSFHATSGVDELVTPLDLVEATSACTPR